MLTRYVQHDLTWVDMVAPSAKELRDLMVEFDLDPRVAEELTSPSPKSKAERHGDLLYTVLHFPALRAAHNRPEHEIDFVVGRNFLITTRYENIDPLHVFAKSFEANTVLGRNGGTHGGHLFVALVRSLYHSLHAECDALRQRLDETEDKIFRGKEREMVANLTTLGRIVHDFRRTLEPHKTMLESIEPMGERLFGVGFNYHLQGVLGEFERVRNELVHLREWLDELRETNNSLLSLKQNETMKNLTVMALLTFPLSLFAALFAIEAKSRPIIGMSGDFWVIVGMMGAIGTGLLLFFWRKGWL